jgi:sarcosine oxidase
MPAPIFDAVVVGLGAVGSAACHHLARAGVRVLGIDRFHPPHDQGSSHGLSRITRLALGEGAAFVPLALRSHELWAELEAASGQVLYRRTGGLCISSPAADARPYHGNSSFFERTVDLARRFGIAHETFDAAGVRERFPMFLLAGDEQAYLERDAGVLYPERIVQAQLDQAAQRGAQLRYGERVESLTPLSNGDVAITTGRDRLVAHRVVLAAGAWLARWPGVRMPQPLRVHRQLLFWFAARDLAPFAPERCPVWIWLHGAGTQGSMYGFPTGDGIEGVKVATEQYLDDADPDRVDRTVGTHDIATMFDSHIAGRLNGVLPRAVRTATCLYTCTPDASFAIRSHAETEAITVISACSGHGFKHSAALGESIAQHVLGQPTRVNLAAW